MKSKIINFFVFDALDRPIIEITSVGCDPYYVKLKVSNPQTGINYYWSNGTTGTDTIITHDGPIEVRAEANGCSITSQINLPIDLHSLAWTFPRGCYGVCDKKFFENKYLIGPLGLYRSWSWLEDEHDALTGNNAVAPFNNLHINHDYQLYLETEYCDAQFENLSIFSNEVCEKCDFDIAVRSIESTVLSGVKVYKLDLNLINLSGSVLTVNLEGYFVSSSYTLPIGITNHIVYFYPINGFEGGAVDIMVEGVSDAGNCYNRERIVFPDLRTNAATNVINTMLLVPNKL